MPEKKVALRKARLTDALVRDAEFAATRQDCFVWDTEAPGFGLRVHKSAKSCVLHYRLKGAGRSQKRVRLKLGGGKPSGRRAPSS